MPRDPRTIITPDAFTVAPELLGYELARPSRRLAAITVDAILAVIVANSGFLLLAAIAVGLFVWRAVAGPIERMVQGRMRVVFRGASVVLALIVLVNAYNRIQESREKDGTVAGNEDVDEMIADLDLSTGEKGRAFTLFYGMSSGDSAKTAANARELGEMIATHTQRGEQRLEITTALAEAIPPQAQAAFRTAAEMDSVVTDPLTLAQRQTARLERRNENLRDEIEELHEKQEERGSVLGFLRNTFDDLGLGLGWFALYFTAFVVLGRGQTPGKRLLSIKIIRLDNKPLGWWLAFERFGGYAASASTGLLGFAQILWDRNRQALHDKATETVVIRLHDGQPVKLSD